MLRRTMRHALLSESELMAQLRLLGVADVARVKRAWVESDSQISVIKREERSEASGRRPQYSP